MIRSIRQAPLRLFLAVAVAVVGLMTVTDLPSASPVHAQEQAVTATRDATGESPPARPTDLQASAGPDSVSLTWTASTDQTVTHYAILLRDRDEDDAGVFEVIDSNAGSATSYTDRSVSPGGSYVYRVKAVSPTGVSQWSSYARADIPADPEDLAPSGLSAKAVFDGGDSAGVELAWDAPAVDAESVTGYEILRAVGDGDLATLAADTGSGGTTYADDTATEAGERYAYRVKALRGEETSQPSDQAVVSIPKVTALPVDPGIAEEQNVTTTLVSNHSLTEVLSDFSFRASMPSQAFTTGSNTNGYNLSGLEIYLRFGSGHSLSDLKVSIWTDSSGVPNSELVVLDNPATAPGTTDLELVTLTAPANTVLAAETTYHVVVRNGASSGTMSLGVVGENGEEAGAAAGWSIANGHRSRSRDDTSASWSAETVSSSRVRVTGSSVNAAAEETTAWVSNTAQTLSTSFIRAGNMDKRHTQGFRTGAESGGYSLGSVGVYVHDEDLESGETFTVHIYTANADGAIDTLVHTLTSPDSYADGAVNLFTAPADATLAANTDYLVVFEATGNADNDFELGITNSTSEDSGSATGWSIENTRRFDNSPSSGILVISVNAAAEESAVVWSATLTVAELVPGSTSGCSTYATGKECSTLLDDDDFTYNGNDYQIVILISESGILNIEFAAAPGDDVYSFELNAGGSIFSFQSATAFTTTFFYVALEGFAPWTVDAEVSLSITVSSADAVSTDATLRALSLSGVTLSPSFAADTLTYTASVDNDVTSTTVTATANDDGATVAIVPADADDTADDHQVTLGVGDTAISVTVTAEDGTTTQTYAVTVTRAAAEELVETTVSADWGLIPSGLGAGDRFRLIFISSTTRDGSSSDIADYNTFVQNAAANGHTDIQSHSSTFRVVGSTADVDARDNTATTYTADDKGVAIYWLGGAQVAGDY